MVEAADDAVTRLQVDAPERNRVALLQRIWRETSMEELSGRPRGPEVSLK